MPKDYPPPSKPERESLVRERAKDRPQPAPVPRPPGTIGAVIDASIARHKAKIAHERERRIFIIDETLKDRKGQAKGDLARASKQGLAKAQSAKAARQITRERTR